MSGGADADDVEEEERKMERFYSLLRSFHNARNRRRKDLDDLEKNDTKSKKMKTMTKQEASTWVPSFEWEDFTTEIEFRKPSLVVPNPRDRRDTGKKEIPEDDVGLDLKLAL